MVAGALAGALLVVMFALGDEPDVTLSGQSVEALATLHDAALAVDASASVPSGDVQAELSRWLAQHPWAVPVVVPDGYRVAAVRTAAGRLEVDLVGPDGLAVLTQTRGRLATRPGYGRRGRRPSRAPARRRPLVFRLAVG